MTVVAQLLLGGGALVAEAFLLQAALNWEDRSLARRAAVDQRRKLALADGLPAEGRL